MENTNQPNSAREPNSADLEIGLAKRLDALEQQMEVQRARVGAAGEAAEDRPLRPAELTAELERHRDQLRDYEKALVERIADVDDDRRATASRLQRAWQTHREEVDERLRRHSGLMVGLLLLFAGIFAVALLLVYREATTGQPDLVAEVADIRQELDRIAGDAESGDRLKGDLARLDTRVAEIASSLDGLDRGGREDADERRSREAGEAGVADDVRRLEGEQTRLMAEVELLRAALKAAEAARAAVPGAGETETPDRASEARSDEPAPKPGAADGTPATEPGMEEYASADAEGDGGASGADADADAKALGSEETLVVGEGSYALQLIGYYNRDSLAAFAAREGLPARVYYLRQTHKGRPWYALVHSLHESSAAAVEELSRLPEDLVALNPWIRPVPTGTKLRVLATGHGQRAVGD